MYVYTSTPRWMMFRVGALQGYAIIVSDDVISNPLKRLVCMNKITSSLIVPGWEIWRL